MRCLTVVAKTIMKIGKCFNYQGLHSEKNLKLHNLGFYLPKILSEISAEAVPKQLTTLI